MKLRGSSLEIALDILNRRLVAGWVMDEIAATLAQMEEEDTMFEEHGTGQGLAEYALILALIAIVAIVALILLGGQIRDALQQVGESILPQ